MPMKQLDMVLKVTMNGDLDLVDRRLDDCSTQEAAARVAAICCAPR